MARTILTIADHYEIGAMLNWMDQELSLISLVVGPAYGAAMCDRVMNVQRKLRTLRLRLSDSCWDQYGGHGPGQPYDGPEYSELRRDARADIRRRATTIIEPAIAYEEPAPWRGGRGARLTGPLTFREHLVIGDILSEMDHALADLTIKRLQYVYGKIHKITGAAWTIIGQGCRAPLITLKSALNDRICSEYLMNVSSIEGVPITQVYYGWRRKSHSGSVVISVTAQ